MNIAIIFNSPETDRYSPLGESKAELGVLDEVQAVKAALAELKHSSILVPLSPPLDQAQNRLKSLQNIDVVFNLFEGFDGDPETEYLMAGMLETLNIPFTGCPASALELALNKAGVKEALMTAGIATPPYQLLTPDNLSAFSLDYPCIIKPLSEDASHGISEESVVFDFTSLEKQVARISSLFNGKALVEEFLNGREFNITILGNERLTVPAISEIVYTLPGDKPRILTFHSKWEEDSLYFTNTRVCCPADINPKEQREISRIARLAFRLTGCQGYARVDLRQDKNGVFNVLEVNPNPDISPDSGVARQIMAAGMTYTQFIQKIIRLALKR